MTTYWTTERPTHPGRYWYRNHARGIGPRIESCVRCVEDAWGGAEEWNEPDADMMRDGEWSKHPIGEDNSAGICLEKDQYFERVFPL